jgi:hypothetical protein
MKQRRTSQTSQSIRYSRIEIAPDYAFPQPNACQIGAQASPKQQDPVRPESFHHPCLLRRMHHSQHDRQVLRPQVKQHRRPCRTEPQGTLDRACFSLARSILLRGCKLPPAWCRAFERGLGVHHGRQERVVQGRRNGTFPRRTSRAACVQPSRFSLCPSGVLLSRYRVSPCPTTTELASNISKAVPGSMK